MLTQSAVVKNYSYSNMNMEQDTQTSISKKVPWIRFKVLSETAFLVKVSVVRLQQHLRPKQKIIAVVIAYST